MFQWKHVHDIQQKVLRLQKPFRDTPCLNLPLEVLFSASVPSNFLYTYSAVKNSEKYLKLQNQRGMAIILFMHIVYLITQNFEVYSKWVLEFFILYVKHLYKIYNYEYIKVPKPPILTTLRLGVKK